MWNKKNRKENEKKWAHRYRQQTVIAGAVHEMGEGGKKVQTSSYKTNKPWVCNVQHGDYS